ncbi:Protein of unknown function [Flavobacterium indicum GPTSA100-9 = DSM 17447]|uniref:Uncharacterized protein n=1 Tax=Flavobacterium indicum (strain DSM 17447 / CIP 109464 / GPTSA100-9) TaxID=1094466 RepID=H8XNZ7_FLAIG|nr:hypothetical protein [Flavobacterium indicum]CCG52264.1 Protein of unknown function [Flavobacterium indicum GPTSA100-9 = DSM 17447]
MIELIIEENIKVRIIQLSQDFTYEGLLEGYPSDFINKMVLENKEERAKKILEIENVYCLNPQEKNRLSDNKFELPSITCMALLKSNQVFKDNKMDFSCLGLIWFQEDLAFPIDDKIIEQIKKVQFKELCSEYEL